MFSKGIMEIIFNIDSCNVFLRERRVLHTLPPICPECNESMAEEKRWLKSYPGSRMNISVGRDTGGTKQRRLTKRVAITVEEPIQTFFERRWYCSGCPLCQKGHLCA